MQITFSPAINNTFKINKLKNNSQPTLETKNINEHSKNSMSEVMGRVQAISFKGINTVEGDYVEHTCTEKTSTHGTIKEHIIFNKKNGNYTHRITDKNGGLIRSEEYYPSQEKEVITTYENDIATITTKTPSLTTIEKLDSENRQIYLEYSTENTTRIEETDYARGRKIIKVTDHDTEHPIIVVNLDTGSVVLNGDLVIDTIYDEERGEYITKNIVTNSIHKREKLDEQGNLVYTKEYNPKNGLIVNEKHYVGEYVEDVFTGEEPNRLVSSLFVSSDGREKEVVLYGEDGETMISHTIYLHRENGTLEQETKLNSSQAIIEKIFYGKGEARTHHFYDEQTNKKKSTKEYDKKGRFVTETLYYEDGKTPKAIKEMNKDGSFVVIVYNREGIEAKRNLYDSKKNLLSSEIYNVKTNSIEKAVEYDLKTGNVSTTIFDEEYETPLKMTVTDKDGTVLSQTVFYEDGKTPHYQREYNKDRSYNDYVFTEKGKLVGMKKFNADGSKKE